MTLPGEQQIEISFQGISSPYAYFLEYKEDSNRIWVTKKPLSLVNNESKEYVSAAAVLSNPVASIYNALRILAAVALLTILVYTGIRMVLSSASRDKVKYKNMFVDWLIALALVFVLHYLMSLVINVSSMLTGIIDGSSIENIMLQIPNATKVPDSSGEWKRLDEGDDGSDFWATNFIGVIRFYAGLVQNKGYTVKGISYTLMYIVIVIYMVIFTFQYLKRVLYMAFLTMIAPLVAITYPIDKLGDGRAQGFTMWLREYIFNALLQVIHCIIYVVIFGSVMELVVDFPLYGIIALGFMVPAEKFIRKLFGFEKASTVGGFGAMAGTAALMGGLQKLMRGSGSKNHNKNSGNEERLKLHDGNSNRGIRTIEENPAIERTANDNGIQGNQGGQPWIDEDWDRDSQGRYFNPYTDEWMTEKELQSGATDNTQQNEETPNESQPETDNTPLDKDIPKETNKSMNFKRNLKNGVRALGGHLGTVGVHLTRRLNRGIKRLHPIRTAGKVFAYGVGAATLGSIGLAAGIASGDVGKTLQYTTAGGIAGGKAGNKIESTVADIVGLEDFAKIIKSGKLGKSKSDIEKNIEKALKSKGYSQEQIEKVKKQILKYSQ